MWKADFALQEGTSLQGPLLCQTSFCLHDNVQELQLQSHLLCLKALTTAVAATAQPQLFQVGYPKARVAHAAGSVIFPRGCKWRK